MYIYIRSGLYMSENINKTLKYPKTILTFTVFILFFYTIALLKKCQMQSTKLIS